MTQCSVNGWACNEQFVFKGHGDENVHICSVVAQIDTFLLQK